MKRIVPAMPTLSSQPRFQFGLRALFGIVTIASILFSSIASGGQLGVLVCLPAVLAGTAVILGAGTWGLRLVCLFLTACGVLLFLLLAGANYPIIVIADSDLGAGAMARVGDWLRLCFACVVGVIVIVFGGFVAWVPVRLVLTLGLLALIITPHFQSPDTPYAARLALVTLIGVLLAADGLPAIATRKPNWLPLGYFGWVMAVPGLLLLADWQGRAWLGLVPSSLDSCARFDDTALGTSASLMGEAASRKAVSMSGRLRATGDEHGNLFVESLDGGPAFHRAPDNPDRTVSFVLFSPNGRILAVGDNHRMYHGSMITIWDVAPGEGGTPPKVRLRHELRGGEHWYFAASFFPDGQTLVISNGDKTVSLWDVESGHEIASFVPHADQPWGFHADCVAASPDGQTFATWAVNGIKVWDRSSLRQLRAMDTRQAIGIALAYTPDAGALVAVDRERVCYWKLAPSPIPFFSLVLTMVGIILWIALSNVLSKGGTINVNNGQDRN